MTFGANCLKNSEAAPGAGSAVIFRRRPVATLPLVQVLSVGSEAPPPASPCAPCAPALLRSRSCAHGPSTPPCLTLPPPQKKLDTMSTVASDGVFLSALQPNSSVTTYGLPSNIRLVNGSSTSDEVSRAQRVQQQVQMRLAEKSTLPRQNGSAGHYAMSGEPPLLSSPCCGAELGYRVSA